jgi:hypothetical protein
VRHRCSRLPQGRPYRSAPNGFLQPGRQDHGACRHARRRSPSPSARRGLPNIRMAEWGRPIAWDCEAFVGKLRDEKWSKCTITDNGEDDKLIHYLNAAPPPAARARADEIIAAFDAWTKKMPRGYWKLARGANKADRAWGRLEKQVGSARATTVEGMIAKMRCGRSWKHDDIQDGGPAHTMALSIIEDLEGQARTV